MNLDDLSNIQKIDSQNMLGEIDHLPDQLASAWALGQTLPDPDKEASAMQFRQVIIAGMGGSAIGADLLAAYIAPVCKIPVIVHRDYGLPAWARGEETLVIASSHSGSTEETLDSFNAALNDGCRMVTVCTGGELAQRAAQHGIVCWQFPHKGQPRAAVGYSFGMLLAMFCRLGLIPDQAADIVSAVAEMKKQQASLEASVPVVHNPAKRYAGQLIGRWVSVYGAGLLSPVARRWKGQVNELAKAGANFEFLPEADHNAFAALINPPDLLMPRTMTLFLRCASDHPRNHLRSDFTRQGFMHEGLNTDLYEAKGDNPLAQMWTALHFGDYLAFYLAIAYQADPTPVDALQSLKAALKDTK
jgi:glucose/mannose-6-phosphate isomerase